MTPEVLNSLRHSIAALDARFRVDCDRSSLIARIDGVGHAYTDDDLRGGWSVRLSTTGTTHEPSAVAGIVTGMVALGQAVAMMRAVVDLYAHAKPPPVP